MPNPNLPEAIVAGATGHISHHNTIHDVINDVDSPFTIRGDTQGTLGARPAAGLSGRYYWATDLRTLYRDDGTTWHEIIGRAPIATFTNGDTTPSVLGASSFKTANAGATSITNFDDGYEGQVITIVAQDANTRIINNANTVLVGGIDYIMNNNDSVTLMLVGSKWIETARAENFAGS